jgi:hypothetical protein
LAEIARRYFNIENDELAGSSVRTMLTNFRNLFCIHVQHLSA